jgi:hypothetical protein
VGLDCGDDVEGIGAELVQQLFDRVEDARDPELRSELLGTRTSPVGDADQLDAG